MEIVVFYNQNLWHTLINMVLSPIFQWDEKGTWSLHFCRVRGDSVILVNSMLNDSEVLTYSYKIDNYISENPSEDKVITFPIKHFFINYPNNSTHTDLHIVTQPNNKFFKTQSVISKCIIDGLCTDEIDDEVLFTFVIYLQIGLIKSYNPYLFEAYSLLLEIFTAAGNQQKHNGIKHGEDPGSSKQFFNFLETALTENKKILTDITEAVLKKQPAADLIWLETWIEHCKTIHSDDFSDTFFQISNLICNQVGLNATLVIPVTFKLIFQSFSEIKSTLN